MVAEPCSAVAAMQAEIQVMKLFMGNLGIQLGRHGLRTLSEDGETIGGTETTLKDIIVVSMMGLPVVLDTLMFTHAA